MTLTLVQRVISDLLSLESPENIDLGFSFINKVPMSEDQFYTMLERLEKRTGIDLVRNAWRFETVKELVNYISNNKP